VADTVIEALTLTKKTFVPIY